MVSIYVFARLNLIKLICHRNAGNAVWLNKRPILSSIYSRKAKDSFTL